MDKEGLISILRGDFFKKAWRYREGKGKSEPKIDLRKKHRLTIMILKGTARVRRFSISPRLIVCASLFFLLYIVATIYFTNKYFDTRRENKIQADKIAKLSTELIKAAKSLERSKRHIALLNDYISESEEQALEPEPPIDYTESSLPKIVDIEDLEIKRDRSTISVTFNIANRQLNEEPIGGYIFVLARPKDSDQSQVWVYPRTLLEDGVPVNYTSGHRFFIENFMSISSKLTLGRSIDKALVLQILVYDRNGTLILKKVVEA